MDIKTGIPADSGPRFCDLCPHKEFDAMFEKIDEWPQQQEPGAGYLTTLQVSFAKGVFDTLDPSIPHLGTIIIGGGDSDDRLQWSEVCWAASLMAGRLRERQYQAYGIVPVSIYRHTNCLLALANVALQGIYILHHQNKCTCDSSTL